MVSLNGTQPSLLLSGSGPSWQTTQCLLVGCKLTCSFIGPECLLNRGSPFILKRRLLDAIQFLAHKVANKKDRECMIRKLKAIGVILLTVWFTGGAISFLLDELDRKGECIDEEGVLKGFFFCSTDSLERDGGWTTGVIKGLGWPFVFLAADRGKAGLSEENGSHDMPQEEVSLFDNSKLGRDYACYTIAKHADLKERASTLENKITDWRRANSIPDSKHNQYLSYSLSKIGNIDEKAHGDLSSYFDYICREPTVATTYKCYLAAVRGGLKEEASTIASAISRMRQQTDFGDQKHLMYLLYSAPEMERIEKTEDTDFASFFEFVCREGVQNMKQMLDDGML